MATGDDSQGVTWHEVLRCTRANETRIYNLCVVANGVELWRMVEAPGEAQRAVQESHFSDPDEASDFLEEVRRALRAGGWREI